MKPTIKEIITHIEWLGNISDDIAEKEADTFTNHLKDHGVDGFCYDDITGEVKLAPTNIAEQVIEWNTKSIIELEEILRAGYDIVQGLQDMVELSEAHYIHEDEYDAIYDYIEENESYIAVLEGLIQFKYLEKEGK